MRFKEWMEAYDTKMLRKVLRKSDMPKGKRKHSERVFKTVKAVGAGEDAQLAAFLHDFFERGGNLSKLQHLGISQEALNVIQHLSDPEKSENEESPLNAPLNHIQSVLLRPNISLKEKRMVILIKLADRLDNLTRRVNAGGVSGNYAKKSSDLLDFLFREYVNWFNQDKTINKMYKRYKTINQQITSQKKKRNLAVEKPAYMPPPIEPVEYPAAQNIFTMSA